MKAHLIDTHLLVPRSRSSAKVKVKCKGYISQKVAVLRAFVFHKHIMFHNVCYAICIFKFFNRHISVVVCSFFEFGTVSEWCITEWVNWDKSKIQECCKERKGLLLVKFPLHPL